MSLILTACGGGIEGEGTPPTDTAISAAGDPSAQADGPTMTALALRNATYSVGGKVGGMDAGKKIVLVNKGANALTVSANGPFVFPREWTRGTTYNVWVSVPPAGQTCEVVLPSGTIQGWNIISVRVFCAPTDGTPATFDLGGTLTGLGSGKTVVLQDGAGHAMNLSAPGTFTFSAPLPNGTAYAVTVATQPVGQNCTVSSGTGTINSAHVTNVSVACVDTTVPTYSIGGSVSGVGTGKFLVLSNAGSTVNVNASGPFIFPIQFANASAYAVTVSTLPVGQSCTVSNGTGTISSANVTNVSVACVNNPVITYSIGGSVSGLDTGKSLVLSTTGSTVTVNASGPFTFPTQFANGSAYAVTVSTPPAEQSCTVSSGSGAINVANVTNVAIACVGGNAGPIYYVARTGDDSRSAIQARNINTPWRTITKAANTLVAGDTVQVRAGTYAEKVAPVRSGSATAGHITFMAYPGETVVMDATGIFSFPIPAWDGAFNISNKSYIKIIGFQIPASDGFGVLIQNSNHIEVSKNIISHTQLSGVFAKESSYIVVDGNDIGFANIAMNQESISMASVTQFSIGNNIVHDGHMEGIDAKNASSYGKIFNNEVYGIARIGIYVEGFGSNQTDIDVYGNIVRDGNPAASGAGEDGIRVGNEHGGTENNIRIFNNIVYNTRKSGISVNGWTHDGSVSRFTNISIYNNTSHGNGFSGDAGWGIRIDAANNNITGLVVRNNIVVGNKSGALTGIPAGQIQSNNFVSGDAKFVSTASHNFRVTAGSPVIDAGYTIFGLTTDFSGAPRQNGAGFDIGAHEYTGN